MSLKSLTVIALLACMALRADSVGASLQLEGAMSVFRGTQYLVHEQLPDGSWRHDPAVTSLAASSDAGELLAHGGLLCNQDNHTVTSYLPSTFNTGRTLIIRRDAFFICSSSSR